MQDVIRKRYILEVLNVSGLTSVSCKSSTGYAGVRYGYTPPPRFILYDYTGSNLFRNVGCLSSPIPVFLSSGSRLNLFQQHSFCTHLFSIILVIAFLIKQNLKLLIRFFDFIIKDNPIDNVVILNCCGGLLLCRKRFFDYIVCNSTTKEFHTLSRSNVESLNMSLAFDHSILPH
ncbi:hypothetical protein H5410_028811 [Solanum commersonii]|uniref:Uncharacterized protein n=1 Tax=Solanum commersonii TaxID=4109 RepID=A0A9J5Z5Z7_SOLCO|nr:hypothetical protein H5410_028811 [Solanum commersonii]